MQPRGGGARVRPRNRFQYPLRVEVGCNLFRFNPEPEIEQCFSTLYGSKWVATQEGWFILFNKYEFQYPLRVEVGCNLTTFVRLDEVAKVSVPSTGRSGLQLYPTATYAFVSERFSTLYGSKWVATDEVVRDPKRDLSFSTLYGSKWVATGGVMPSPKPRTGFSTLYGSKWVATRRTSTLLRC